MPETIQQFITRNNIAQFQRQIKDETDDSMRKVLVTLLAKERAKLKAISVPD